MFDAVADWLRSVTSVVPLLFVLDDLHWATRPTLQLLRHVIDVVDPAPLMVVAAYRDTESGRRRSLDELLADMYRRPDVERADPGRAERRRRGRSAGRRPPAARWRRRPGPWLGPSGPRPEATRSSPASSCAT